ncbi:hypothetical protein [Rhodopseudomonas sp.]|uniref:hypothetical protein n=1 Tax=Rhodopseudomonas sp. TaxID=1078 RepID=UPI003B3A050A
MLQVLERGGASPFGRPMRKAGPGKAAAAWRFAVAVLGALLLFYSAARVAVALSAQQGELNDARRLAARLTWNGAALADEAAARARRVLDQPSADASALRTDNAEAQAALMDALSVSPLSAEHWLLLALLKRQRGEPAVASLKMSFLTGPIPPVVVLARLRAVATSAAARDEEISLLAQSDIRGLLVPSAPAVEQQLRGILRDATPDGRAFLRSAISAVDVGLAAKLQ